MLKSSRAFRATERGKALSQALPPAFHRIGRGVKTLGWMGAAMSGAAAAGGIVSGTHPAEVTPILPALPFHQLPGGSGNLKMGGLFGVGSVGEKIIDLNTRMLERLQVIAINTNNGRFNPTAASAFTGYTYTPNYRAGGL
jgi:hypothetical protein